MKTSERIINHPSQLNSLSVISLMRPMTSGKLRLEGNISNHPSKEKWEAELNKYYFACGCDTGAKGLMLGLIGGSIYSYYNYAQDIWKLGTAIPADLIIVIAATVAGKIYGLAKAHSAMINVIKEIKKEWVVENPPSKEIMFCG